MLTMASEGHLFRFLGKTQLLKLKVKAIRAGVWFKALPRIDRALVDLTIQVANSIRSKTLIKSILAVTRKLQELLESSISRNLTEIGLPIARKLSALAQKWGNRNAQDWANNIGFVRYLALMTLSENLPNGTFHDISGVSTK
jgi:hypothetical protein